MTPITYLKGDATQPQGPGPRIIAHCCNNVGAWGAGFVLAISRRWTAPEREYKRWAKEIEGRLLPLGHVQFVQVEPEIAVANIIGQHGTQRLGDRPPIRYASLQDGFEVLSIEATKRKASVHAPRIGCGLAGGEWHEVQRLIEASLCAIDVPVFIYDLQ